MPMQSQLAESNDEVNNEEEFVCVGELVGDHGTRTP